MATDPTKDPIVQAEEDALARQAQREADNKAEVAALKDAQDAELAAAQAYNTAQYENLGQIVGDIQSKIDIAKAKDETAQKRENAYRYISGVGDTISSLANLVGTAHGASNQQQTYNSHAVVQKAEEARKARKLEMDDLSKRMDEMKTRERELKAAGSLAEAQMGVQHQKEQMNLKLEQEKRAREAEQNEREMRYKERQLAVAEKNAESSAIRAEAYDYGQHNPKPKSTAKPPKKHPIEIVGGKTIEIPDHMWTDTAIGGVYDLIAEESRTRRARMVKDAAGRDVEQKDASGNTVYHTPTKQEMINDIVKAAKTDENVAKALQNLAKGGANSDKYK